MVEDKNRELAVRVRNQIAVLNRVVADCAQAGLHVELHEVNMQTVGDSCPYLILSVEIERRKKIL